jgi:hypothetical protein
VIGPGIFRMIKSRGTNWVGMYFACDRKLMRTYRYFWSEVMKARDHLKDVAEDGRLILI